MGRALRAAYRAAFARLPASVATVAVVPLSSGGNGVDAELSARLGVEAARDALRARAARAPLRRVVFVSNREPVVAACEAAIGRAARRFAARALEPRRALLPLDAMLPRQTLRLVGRASARAPRPRDGDDAHPVDPAIARAIAARARGGGKLGVVGRGMRGARRRTSLAGGAVKARVTVAEAGDAASGEGTVVDIVAGRRVRLVGEQWWPEGGPRESFEDPRGFLTAEGFLPRFGVAERDELFVAAFEESDDENDDDARDSSDDDGDDASDDGGGRAAARRAHPLDVVQARLVAELLDEWEAKVRAFGFERFEGQLDLVKRALGARPPPERPFAFALWACALVNPLPVLGVAPELRPEVLAARTATEALRAVLLGVRHSIEHVESGGDIARAQARGRRARGDVARAAADAPAD